MNGDIKKGNKGFGVKLIGWIAFTALLTACSTQPPSRYSIENDLAPSVELDVSGLPDPVPVYEAKSRGGNKSPYEVWGKTYTVLSTAEGYRERGGASWYGAKFHGHKTSNGETYNMYEMTAAHKSLPLPTFAKVTNLDNGRSVIVRVNDRGPFHEGRIIDLSYAAAKKLGYYSQGIANVEVEAITVAPNELPSSGPSVQQVVPPKLVTSPRSKLVEGYGYYIQVGAFSTEGAAQKLKRRVDETMQPDSFVMTATKADKVFHRVRMGPFYDIGKAEQLLKQLKEFNIGSPIIIARPTSS